MRISGVKRIVLKDDIFRFKATLKTIRNDLTGVSIYIHTDDHSPAHYHAHGDGFEVKINIDECSVYKIVNDKKLRTNMVNKLLKWTKENRVMLLLEWNKTRADNRGIVNFKKDLKPALKNKESGKLVFIKTIHL